MWARRGGPGTHLHQVVAPQFDIATAAKGGLAMTTHGGFQIPRLITVDFLL